MAVATWPVALKFAGEHAKVKQLPMEQREALSRRDCGRPQGDGACQNGLSTGRTSLSQLNFLIVEDHAFQRTMLEQLLRGLGANEVHSAANGAEAMTVLRDPTRMVDIVITDLVMPGVDGIELLPMLRKAAPGVWLVLTSANDAVLLAAVEIAKAHGLAVLGAVVKPLSAVKLQPLLNRYVAERRAPE